MKRRMALQVSILPSLFNDLPLAAMHRALFAKKQLDDDLRDVDAVRKAVEKRMNGQSDAESEDEDDYDIKDCTSSLNRNKFLS